MDKITLGQVFLQVLPRCLLRGFHQCFVFIFSKAEKPENLQKCKDLSESVEHWPEKYSGTLITDNLPFAEIPVKERGQRVTDR